MKKSKKRLIITAVIASIVVFILIANLQNIVLYFAKYRMIGTVNVTVDGEEYLLDGVPVSAGSGAVSEIENGVFRFEEVRYGDSGYDFTVSIDRNDIHINYIHYNSHKFHSMRTTINIDIITMPTLKARIWGEAKSTLFGKGTPISKFDEPFQDISENPEFLISTSNF